MSSPFQAIIRIFSEKSFGERIISFLFFTSLFLFSMILFLSWLLFTGKIAPANAFNGWARIYGQVTEKDGSPVPGALVSIGPLQTKTDVSGIFEIECIPAEKHFISVTREGYRRFDRVFEFVPGPQPLKITLEKLPVPILQVLKNLTEKKELEEEEETFKIPPPATIPDHRPVSFGGELRGIVLDRDTKKPLPRAMVSLGNTTVFTDKDGLFRLRNIPFGNYELEVSSGSYRHYRKKLQISKRVTDIKISLLKEE